MNEKYGGYRSGWEQTRAKEREAAEQAREESLRLARLAERTWASVEKSGSAGAYEDHFEVARLVREEDAGAAWALTCRLRGQIEGAIAGHGEAGRLYRLYAQTLFFDAWRDFDCYIRYLEWDREPDKKFYEPRRRVLKAVVDDLQDLHDGVLDILGTSLPPGTGKTGLSTMYVSWQMGLFPGKPTVYSSYSGTVTHNFFTAAQEVVTSGEYRWAAVFRRKIHNVSAKFETIDVERKHMYPTLICRPMDASNTGVVRVGRTLIVDDPISGIEEAMSEDRVQTRWMKYSADLKQRKLKGANEWHIGTRWTVRDVIGRLSALYGESPKVRFRSIPALDVEGESNFLYGHGLGFDKAFYMDMKMNLDEASFQALYMGEPIEREGLLYPADELRRYYGLPEGEPDKVISVCDTKDKGQDYAFLPVAYVYGEDYYIEDCMCDNGVGEEIDAQALKLFLGHRVDRCQFESNSAGGVISERIEKKLLELGGKTHITTSFTSGNKETRIIVNSTWVKGHCLFRKKYEQGSGYAKMMDFLCKYTVSGKNRHDDVPDGMAMLAVFAESLLGRKLCEVGVMRRIF
jgi:predicted phage terminase large subunit-like protein